LRSAVPLPTTIDQRTTVELIALTERGRIRAVLVTLEACWCDLTLGQQGHALELFSALAACYRGRPTERDVKLWLGVHRRFMAKVHRPAA
jgi:hypothetical protein